jgi:hypothetical protein
MAQILILDIRKIEQQIAHHEAEASNLREFLLRAKQFAPDAVAQPKRRVGRPRKNEPRDVLAGFIDRQAGDFSNLDLKHALNGQKYPKYKFRAAIKQLIDEGKLIEVVKPAGVRPGLYRRNATPAAV